MKDQKVYVNFKYNPEEYMLLNTVNRFCDFKQNDVYQNQFYCQLIDINKSYVPMASHQ